MRIPHSSPQHSRFVNSHIRPSTRLYSCSPRSSPRLTVSSMRYKIMALSVSLVFFLRKEQIPRGCCWIGCFLIEFSPLFAGRDEPLFAHPSLRVYWQVNHARRHKPKSSSSTTFFFLCFVSVFSLALSSFDSFFSLALPSLFSSLSSERIE
jgi:hypothetical protein